MLALDAWLRELMLLAQLMCSSLDMYIRRPYWTAERCKRSFQLPVYRHWDTDMRTWRCLGQAREGGPKTHQESSAYYDRASECIDDGPDLQIVDVRARFVRGMRQGSRKTRREERWVIEVMRAKQAQSIESALRRANLDLSF